ncbi:hypothetical protein ILUMI_11988 [Ignelater luminosus]|uniref:Uncharacterized protein n=1 Tax=Ignelater luminosus TaxID=2038154 RepID=A0A8K0GCR5_IGNLU|nr:hypothetical protein ILUMI_11988 [Ignelater luminosus]
MKEIETIMRNLEKKQIKNNIVISGIKMKTDNQMDLEIEMKKFIEKYEHKDTNKGSNKNRCYIKKGTDKMRTGNLEENKRNCGQKKSYEDGKLKEHRKDATSFSTKKSEERKEEEEIRTPKQ